MKVQSPITTLWGSFLLCLFAVAMVSAQGTELDSTTVDDEVELHVDFSTGFVIANEAPRVVIPIDNHAIVLGTADTVIAKLTDVFDDAENGTALSYSAESSDESLVQVGLNPADSSLSLSFAPNGVEGRTTVIVTANDGTKSVSDTFSVVVKELFVLGDSLADTTVKSGETPTFIDIDITTLLPLVDSSSSETYTVIPSSSDESLITASINSSGSAIQLEIVDSGFGLAEISVVITDNDGFTVNEAFSVTVKRDFGSDEYLRKTVRFNPGMTIFTGIDYSGVGASIWINDFWGFALNGYYYWDQNGIGTDLAFLVKPHLNYVLQPYALGSVGYHRETVNTFFEEYNFSIDNDLPLLVVRGAVGAAAWVGPAKRHVIGVEGGYTYGKKEYNTLVKTDYGEENFSVQSDTFKMSPLHLRVYYSFYFQVL